MTWNVFSKLLETGQLATPLGTSLPQYRGWAATSAVQERLSRSLPLAWMLRKSSRHHPACGFVPLAPSDAGVMSTIAGGTAHPIVLPFLEKLAPNTWGKKVNLSNRLHEDSNSSSWRAPFDARLPPELPAASSSTNPKTPRRVTKNAPPINERLIYTARAGNNNQVFRDILQLYVSEGSAIADLTWGRGNFWEGIDQSKYNLIRLDKYAPCDFNADFRAVPLDDGSQNAVVFDPPYATKTVFLCGTRKPRRAPSSALSQIKQATACTATSGARRARTRRRRNPPW